MTYDVLVSKIARLSGLHTDVIKRVLYYMPNALMTLQQNAMVQTPLGTFRMYPRKARSILLPDGETKSVVPGMKVIRFKASSRLIQLDAPDQASP